MIHMPLSERIRLLASRIPIAISISILRLRTLIGVVPCLLAFEASDVTQIFLHWCRRVEMLLVAIPSIAIAIAIPLLGLRTIGGIVSCLLALETGDMTQILLSRSRTVLVAIASIA